MRDSQVHAPGHELNPCLWDGLAVKPMFTMVTDPIKYFYLLSEAVVVAVWIDPLVIEVGQYDISVFYFFADLLTCKNHMNFSPRNWQMSLTAVGNRVILKSAPEHILQLLHSLMEEFFARTSHYCEYTPTVPTVGFDMMVHAYSVN